MDVIVWAALVVMFVIVEVATVQLVSIWLAAGAMVTMFFCCFTDVGLLGQLIIFAVTSVIGIAVTVPFLRKRLNRGYTATNSELELGRSAVVIETIDPDRNSGRVTLNGVNWGALSADGSLIPQDSIVTVTEVKGTKLVVKPRAC
ncbi:MAG: NfeD family protein [Alistipes sp.]|nr:NfeD family protein [Alistipes sp.]